MPPETHSEAIGDVQGLSNRVSKLELPSSASPPEDKAASPTEKDSPPTTTTTTTTTTQNPTTTTTTIPKHTHPFQFGQRHLDASSDVFSHNAWDHVAPSASHHAYSEQQYAQQRLHPVSAFDKARFNSNPAKWWDLFYQQKSSTFFKDRRWLRQEFPVLDAVTRRGAGRKVVLEVGAGAGNTAFPLVRQNENDELKVWAVDFSSGAVRTMRGCDGYEEFERKGVLRVEVWDVSSTAALPSGLDEASVDVVIMIFVFSALSPEQWDQAVRNIYRVLKPGGEVLFRDYGRGDLAQVRFKAGRWMEENFYVRGDGTRVYFFDKDELAGIWAGDGNGDVGESSGKQGEEVKGVEVCDARRPRFEILNLDVDRRLIVNRQKKIKMYRCWIQARFRNKTGPWG